MAFFTHAYGLCWSYVLPVALSHCTAIRRGHVTSLLLLLLSMYVCVCAQVHVCYSVHVEDKGQLLRTESHLRPCGDKVPLVPAVI